MRFMMLVKATKDCEAGALPDEKMLSEIGNYNEELVKAGALLAVDGLQASSKGTRVRYSNVKFKVVDGPFAETKELIAGFWLIQAKSKEEAIEWAKHIPFQEGEVEVERPVAVSGVSVLTRLRNPPPAVLNEKPVHALEVLLPDRHVDIGVRPRDPADHQLHDGLANLVHVKQIDPDVLAASQRADHRPQRLGGPAAAADDLSEILGVNPHLEDPSPA